VKSCGKNTANGFNSGNPENRIKNAPRPSGLGGIKKFGKSKIRA
jgi:hypothetical protein